MQTLTVGLAQIAPRLGQFEENLERHRAIIRDARERGAGLVVFPELGLTGYLLQDLAAEVAIRLDDPRLAALAADTAGMSAVVSFVEESADHRLFIAAALLEDGRIRHVHRKLFLPTYGLFDERRFFAAGDLLRATPSRLGVGVGLAVCEDFWHLTVAQLLALDGAQILINVSSSPGRDLAATNEVGLGTATSWRTLMRTYAQLTTSIVIFCNRVGVDESISFWGGSE
ncbi:MAG TPA: nitrilase-related carbon-nitrogen hydrolase, partial [Candidatus Limnocylindrales bacterium]|nr:nitrilase-related carbon-nitrogen hydrolase [Candidatus Limnocylindrales bacterium]